MTEPPADPAMAAEVPAQAVVPKNSPLKMWVDRFQEANARAQAFEARAIDAEAALARQQQVNALALDMLTDAQLLALHEAVRIMDNHTEPEPPAPTEPETPGGD